MWRERLFAMGRKREYHCASITKYTVQDRNFTCIIVCTLLSEWEVLPVRRKCSGVVGRTNCWLADMHRVHRGNETIH